MSFKCQSCNKYTLDLNEPPCGKTCETFRPTQVATIHLVRFDENRRLVMACSGDRPRSQVHFTSTPLSTTCPLCLESLQRKEPQKQQKQSKPTSLPEKQAKAEEKGKQNVVANKEEASPKA